MRYWLTAFLAFAGCSHFRQTSLNEAVSAGDRGKVVQLLEQGADINQPGAYGVTPIASAARRGDASMIELLAEKGADLNLGSGVNGWTPLVHAIHKNQRVSVQALLKAGAEVDSAPNASGMTALMMAAGYGYADIVADLLAHGADPARRARNGATALTAAVGGTADIDRFTTGKCQGDAVRAILAKSPAMRLGDTKWDTLAAAAARTGGCREVLAMVGR